MATAAKFDADFSKFLGELNKVEIELKDFSVNSEKASGAARRMADSLNGNKIAEQAAIAARGLLAIDGGVERLTKGEIRRLGPVIDEAVEKFNKMGRAVPADIAQVKAALDTARAPVQALADEIEKTTGAGSGLVDLFTQGLGLGAGVSALGLAQQALGAVTEQLGAMWTEGQKLTQLGTAFESLQGGPRQAAVQLTKLREATSGLVSDVDLLTAANKASLLGLNEMGIQTDELAQVAVRLGKAMGQDAAKSVDDLTTALARQSPMILDNLGLKVSLSDANEAYARTLGKSESALTDEERKLAFSAAAMDAARAKLATLGEQHETVNEQIGAMSIKYDNARAAMGRWINENEILNAALQTIIKDLDEFGSGLARLVQPTKDATKESDFFISLWQEAQSRPDAWVPGVRGLEEFNAVLKISNSLLETWVEYQNEMTRKLVTGAPAIDPASLPTLGRGKDISLDGGRKAQSAALAASANARAKQVLDDSIAKYESDQERRLTEIENAGQQARKSQAEKAARERLDAIKRVDDMTGKTQIASAQALQKDLASAMKQGRALTEKAAAEAWRSLFDAKKIAAVAAPELVAGIDESLRKLATHPGVVAEARAFSEKIVPKLFDPEVLKKGAIKGIKDADIGQNLAAALKRSIGAQGLTIGTVNGKATTQNLLADTYALRKGLDGIGVPLTTINEGFYKATKSSGDLLTKVSALSTAFSNMANIGGEKFGGIAQGMGEAVSAIEASMKTVDLLGEAFGGKDSDFAKSGAGKALGGALVGMQLGAQFGAMAGSPGKGALAGAASGAAGGAMYGGWGALVGAGAGAISGYFAGRKAQKQAREAMADQKSQLLQLYGTRENLIKQAKRLGISEAEVNKNILNNSKDTKAYAATFGKLSEATAKEEAAAEALSKTLGDVARVRGVLSQQQTKDLRAALAAGEGPMVDAAEGFLNSQRESLLQGLQGALDSGGLSPALVGAIGDSLPAAFAELRRSGLSAVDSLRLMEPLLKSFQANAVNAGLGSAQGFDTLNQSLGILNDEKLGPLVKVAGYASQSMAALMNLGYGNQAAYSGFAQSITDAFSALQAGAGTDQALMLMHEPLQTLWQLTRDFGVEVDENTARMLEQAEAAGAVGDKFRPASERAAAALDQVVAKLDEIIAVFKGDMVAGAGEGAQDAGAKILDEFAKVQPVVRVRYEYDTPEAPGAPSGGGRAGTNAARDATEHDGSGDVYMDGERVGFIVGRHLGTVSDYAGA